MTRDDYVVLLITIAGLVGILIGARTPRRNSW
jgi:hypothetical protein